MLKTQTITVREYCFDLMSVIERTITFSKEEQTEKLMELLAWAVFDEREGYIAEGVYTEDFKLTRKRVKEITALTHKKLQEESFNYHLTEEELLEIAEYTFRRFLRYTVNY